MATLDYIDIPVGATRLRAISQKKAQFSNDMRPATKIMTSLPNPSPPPSPTLSKRRPSLLSSTTSLTSPALSLLPQLLLSSTLPPSSPHSAAASSSLSSTTQNNSDQLLSSRDPISIPTMTINFKRFVSVIGPVFWLQDRIEEIIMWKRGWKRTTVWMALYVFLCSFRYASSFEISD